jgi:hypothetical protein
MSILKKISDNELSELMDLMTHVNAKLHDYLHVTDYLPIPLKNQIESFSVKLNNEFDRREDEF